MQRYNYQYKYIQITCHYYYMSALAVACRSGDVVKVQNLISKESKTWNWDFGLAIACRAGHVEIAELMITKGANVWNFGCACACAEGHVQIVELMISKGAKNWNCALLNACRGYSHIAELMTAKGTTDCSLSFGSHMKIITMVLSKGATNYEELEKNKINIPTLVFEYGLSMAILERVSKVQFQKIRQELETQEQIVDTFLLTELCCILFRYVIRYS